MKYKILWMDSTMTRQPSMLGFKHWRTYRDDGQWKDLEVWDFIEAQSDIDAIHKAIEYVENSDRILEVFSLAYRGRIIATEEDLWDYDTREEIPVRWNQSA